MPPNWNRNLQLRTSLICTPFSWVLQSKPPSKACVTAFQKIKTTVIKTIYSHYYDLNSEYVLHWSSPMWVWELRMRLWRCKTDENSPWQKGKMKCYHLFPLSQWAAQLWAEKFTWTWAVSQTFIDTSPCHVHISYGGPLILSFLE